jgi:hypothetical protein
MDSRMNKYYEEDVTNSRFHRNEALYNEISKNAIENYSIKSNALVLGDNEPDIDVEKIKKILDTKYNTLPKRKSIRLEDEEKEEIIHEDTKEYDINVILEKAKENKSESYEEERLRKLRDTQYDILNNLNINKKEEEIEENEDLKTLINTINYNEKNNSADPLDMLSDLKGNDDTEVLDGLKDEVSKELDEITNDNDDLVDENTMTTQMINSFYTTSNALKAKDFEDMDDFTKSIEENNNLIKVVIVVVVIAVLIGIAFLIKSMFFS